MGDAKPVGNADDGAQVARVLYAIQGEAQFLGVDFRKAEVLLLRLFLRVVGILLIAAGILSENSQHLLRMLQEAHLLQLLLGHLYHFCLSRKVLAVEPLLGSHNEVGWLQGEQVIYYLETFRHELSFLVAVLLQFERTNVFYLILANHLLLFLIFNGCKGSIKSRQYKIKSAKYFVFSSFYTIFAI